jgi:hypothetical protein
MHTIDRMAIAIALSLLLLAGCSNGVLFNSGLYSHTVEPLTFNRYPTDVEKSEQQASGDIRHIQYYVAVEWGTNGIGDVARKNGINTVYYADIEKLRVFFGIWQQNIVHVYGR